jgi:diacylglycerol kinase (ATP)
MCNYFSLGVESRVGLGFEKSRTGNAVCNKIVYFYEGLKKMCCKKTLRIKDALDYVTVKSFNGDEEIIFASSKTKDCPKYLSGNPVTLVCTNINSIMGGRANLWEEGKERKIGLVNAVDKQITNKELNFKDEVAHDDELVEFESLASIIHMALGKSNRVA